MANEELPDTAPPWTILVVAGSVRRNGELCGLDELSARFGVLVAGAWDTGDDGGGGIVHLDASAYADVRAAMHEARRMIFDVPSTITDAASVRAWALEQMRTIRARLDAAEAALHASAAHLDVGAIDGDVGCTADILAEAATVYADVLFQLHLFHDVAEMREAHTILRKAGVH